MEFCKNKTFCNSYFFLLYTGSFENSTGYLLYKQILMNTVIVSAAKKDHQIPFIPIKYERIHINGSRSISCLSILMIRLNPTLLVDCINDAAIVAAAANT